MALVMSRAAVLRAGADQESVAHLDEGVLVTRRDHGERREQRVAQVVCAWAPALYRVPRRLQVPKPVDREGPRQPAIQTDSKR